MFMLENVIKCHTGLMIVICFYFLPRIEIYIVHLWTLVIQYLTNAIANISFDNLINMNNVNQLNVRCT